jgi:hypothetical protein
MGVSARYARISVRSTPASSNDALGSPSPGAVVWSRITPTHDTRKSSGRTKSTEKSACSSQSSPDRRAGGRPPRWTGQPERACTVDKLSASALPRGVDRGPSGRGELADRLSQEPERGGAMGPPTRGGLPAASGIRRALCMRRGTWSDGVTATGRRAGMCAAAGLARRV